MHQRITQVNPHCQNAGVHNHMRPVGDSRQIIRQLLKSRGFNSPRALAITAGVSQPTLSRYLSGESDDMEMPTWRALADALEVTVSQLLGESPIGADPDIVSVTRAMERLPAPQRAALVAAANAMAEAAVEH